MNKNFFDIYPEYSASLKSTIFAYVKSPLNPRFGSKAPSVSGITILSVLGYLEHDNKPTKKFLNAIIKHDIPADEGKFMIETNAIFDKSIEPFVAAIVQEVKNSWLEYLAQ